MASAAFIPKTIRHMMATALRTADVPETGIQRCRVRACSGKAERYAKFRPDYLGQAVAAIDAYTVKIKT